MIARRTVLAQALKLGSAGLLAACQYQVRPSDLSFDGPTPLPPVVNPKVGGATISPATAIADGVAATPELTTLSAAIHSAGLASRLRGIGWFTLFAPTNAAFDKLPPDTRAALLGDDDALRRVLRYHLAWGRLTATTLLQQTSTFGGTAPLPTLARQDLTIHEQDDRLVLAGAGGGSATLVVPDVYQSNGVINVIDAVLMPAGPA
jgi:uncharacterized surface protein with fasciclin (FAS1) repeats